MSHIEDEDDDYPVVDYDDVVTEINAHEAAELITCEKAFPSGYVTFTFYQEGNCIGKMTFDELSEDTAFRAKAVLDFISTAQHVLVDQVEIEKAWEDADPDAVHTRSLR
jgi:predicted acetyltransferase